MAREVAVMYLGRVVEQAEVHEIFKRPLHPYTAALMRSIPSLTSSRKSHLQTIAGTVPDPFERLEGCPFHPRCPEARTGLCNQGSPPSLRPVSEGHKVACVLRNGSASHG